MIQKKALPFKIPKTTSASLILQVDKEAYFYDKLHQHEEFQLTCVLSGFGTLVHGEYVGQFQAGDVFLMGSNVPHVFRCDSSFYTENKVAHSISVFFNYQQLNSMCKALPEFAQIDDFLEEARLGGKAIGDLNSSLREKIEELFGMNEFNRLVSFFQMLNDLSKQPNWQPLLDQSAKRLKEQDGKRLNAIFSFTLSHYQRHIPLEEIADVANMNKSSFCRYFKQHTRKSYIDFLNEYRVQKACSLLASTESSIAQVAFEVGFSNLSNFNRQFKRLKQLTPKQYRTRLVLDYN